MRRCVFCLLLLGLCATFGRAQRGGDWPTYGGDAGGQRYSTARQITRANVKGLVQAWEYHTGALTERPGHLSASFEATPILFHDMLLFSTPFDEIVALNARTGAKVWSFDPVVTGTGEGNLTTSRGVAVWRGPAKLTGPCRDRVFEGTLDGRMLAIDAATGFRCAGFGSNGQVNLKTAEVDYQEGHLLAITSPPAVVGDVVIVGSSLPDNFMVSIERGSVRGYDVRTGQRLWAWDPLPWANAQKLRTGAANAWSVLSADPALGLVYVPTGSPSPDYYGGMRPGNNEDSDSVVALDARTGRKVWAFQLVHHDLWDYDVAAQPLLFTLRGIPALAVTNKSGMVYVLDRRTGKPLYPVQERPVPVSDVPGEHSSPTQPFSSLPNLGPTSPFDGSSEQWQRSPARQAECDSKVAGLRYRGMFNPPSLTGSMEFPGKLGGVNWGSMAFDPQTGFLYANNNRSAYEVRLVLRTLPAAPPSEHHSLITPPRLLAAAGLLLLLGIALLWRHTATGAVLVVLALTVFFAGIIQHRRHVRREAERVAEAAVQQRYAAYKVLHTILGVDDSPQLQTPYGLYLRPVSDSDGLPCAKQPWGAITSLNLNNGAKRWERPLGTMVGDALTGSVELGGPIVTAGGLVFSAGTRDPFLRAFDKLSGEEVWTQRLPAPAQATPMTYTLDGRQYVVIAAGGHGLFNTKQDDALIAYTLPPRS